MLVLWTGVAGAGGRKRVVVLDFEGPKSEELREEIVKLIKHQHTVVPTKRWSEVADGMDAGKVTEKNVKKVAKNLKIDGVITGKIEKRRDEYIIQIKLRAGTSGEMVGQRVDTKSGSGHLDSKAERDLKEELLPAIDDLEANHGGGGGGGDEDEGDTKPKKDKKVAKKDDDDSDVKPKKDKKVAKSDDDDGDDSAPAKKKGFSKKFDKASDDDGDVKPKKDKKAAKKDDDDEGDVKPKKDKKAAKKDDDESAALSTKHDEDENPLPKGKKDKKVAKSDDDDGDAKAKKDKKAAKKDDDADSGDGGDKKHSKKVAKKDDEGDGDTEVGAAAEPSGDVALNLSPGQRALDATVGLSFTARQLTFKSATALSGSQVPPHYAQSIPVAGAVFDFTVFPMAWGHKREGAITGLGIELGYDKVIKINSQKAYGIVGMQKVADLTTKENSFDLAAVFRYPIGKSPTAPVVGGRLAYETKMFTIAQETPDMASTDIPNVHYSMIEPSVFGMLSVMPKLTIQANVGLLVISSAGDASGDIGNGGYYGPISASGYQLNAGAEYALTPRIFARGNAYLETMSMTFSTDATKAGTQVFNRDTDPASQDVMSAADKYYGLSVTLGFLY
jgi:hypothetical protein